MFLTTDNHTWMWSTQNNSLDHYSQSPDINMQTGLSGPRPQAGPLPKIGCRQAALTANQTRSVSTRVCSKQLRSLQCMQRFQVTHQHRHRHSKGHTPLRWVRGAASKRPPSRQAGQRRIRRATTACPHPPGGARWSTRTRRPPERPRRWISEGKGWRMFCVTE